MTVRAFALAAALTAVSLAATPALGSDKTDVIALVNQYSDAFSTHNMKAANALCADHAVIIDDFAPHVWQGATACADWWNAFVADNKKSGISGGVVKLGAPSHVTVTADRAYAVFPLTFTFKHNGTPTTSHGVWTFALHKLAAGWRIAGWAFSLQRSG